jgi:hypothetical protein
MWQPGESGNPSGVSKAYAEATREVSMRPIELSPGAERTRRWRERKQQDVMVVSVAVAQNIVAKLIDVGLLEEAKFGDKEAIATALLEFVKRATELEGTPVPRSM